MTNRSRLYSITSSARASSASGTVRPSTFGGLQVDYHLEVAECLNTQYRASRIMLSGVSAARRT
jgi:hypothetical protein